MKKKVLVIEDEDIIRDYLVYEISYAGFEVISACSGNEAIKILNNIKVDAIVSDFRMPDGNGIDVLDFAKKLEYSPRFFFISADSSFISDYSSNVFVDKIFTKPFVIDEILSALKKEK